jgi:[protein-PII] uridylyltransferase
MPEESIRRVTALIENHLVLSSAMNGRDLDDPATARWLADKVGTIELLKYLVLVTYADISAVNPTAMTPWRLDQLWRVYRTAERELKRELEDDRIQAAAGGDPEREAFLKGFPTRYLRTHTSDQVAAHVALEGQRKAVGIAVEIVRRGPALYELTVLAKDRLSLFSSIAGSLAGFGLNILKAEAFANQQGTILDTFFFSDPTRNLELNPQELDRLRQTIERVVMGKADPRSLLRNRRTPPAPSRGSNVAAGVTFDNEASEVATLVEVIAQDRPGLLYDLASAISAAGCNIDVVLIDTEAHKALDVFYVTANGRKLDDGLRTQLEMGLLRACRC